VAEQILLHGIKVMVIDDSNTIRRSAEIFLLQSGCTVILAEDGFDALAKITDHQPDLVFVDIMMPRLDGYQTCALIKKNAKFQSTPVVMLSSKDGLFDRARGRMVGSDQYLTKPFTKESLLRRSPRTSIVPRHDKPEPRPKTPARQEPARESVGATAQGRNMAIRKILIVDDSPTERHVLNDMLSKSGFEVVASDNGEDAILKAKSLKPDLILMDVVMPGLNGFQATRAISRDPDTRLIPIILCTSKSQETDKIWGMRQGARDYIVKPVNREELLEKIAAIG
jgi:twitching motility two-component system response regulator PilG